MLPSFRAITDTIRLPRDEPDAEVDPGGLASLRVIAAELLLLTAAESARSALTAAREARAPLRPADYARAPAPTRSLAETWAPALVAPLAAGAHLAHAVRPSEATDDATRILDLAVAGLGVATAVAGIVRGGRGQRVPLAPLALASAGLLGLALRRAERSENEERRRLERRASIIDRVVPRRRPRIDHIVVHV